MLKETVDLIRYIENKIPSNCNVSAFMHKDEGLHIQIYGTLNGCAYHYDYIFSIISMINYKGSDTDLVDAMCEEFMRFYTKIEKPQ